MGSLSIWHWLIFLAVALLFFGGSGKISSIMGDFAKGIKSFKKGLQDDAEDAKAAKWSPGRETHHVTILSVSATSATEGFRQ